MKLNPHAVTHEAYIRVPPRDGFELRRDLRRAPISVSHDQGLGLRRKPNSREQFSVSRVITIG